MHVWRMENHSSFCHEIMAHHLWNAFIQITFLLIFLFFFHKFQSCPEDFGCHLIRVLSCACRVACCNIHKHTRTETKADATTAEYNLCIFHNWLHWSIDFHIRSTRVYVESVAIRSRQFHSRAGAVNWSGEDIWNCIWWYPKWHMFVCS